MEKLVALGTGYAIATKCYTTSFALLLDDEIFLIDTGGGNGLLTRLEQAQLSINDVHHVFLSHKHTDHILGSVWLIRMVGHNIAKGFYHGSLTIYCHHSLIEGLKAMCQFMLPKNLLAYFGERIIFSPVRDEETLTVCQRQVTFFDTGSLKTIQFGLKITLSGGKTLVFLGDEPYHGQKDTLLYGCDYLMHEAFCLERDKAVYNPHNVAHSTVKDACHFANYLHAKGLILYHTEDHQLAVRKKDYTAEAEGFFAGAVFVPDDLDTIIL